MAKYDVISYLMDLDLVTEAIYGGSKAIFQNLHFSPSNKGVVTCFFQGLTAEPCRDK